MNSGKADITGMRVWTTWLAKTLSDSEGNSNEHENGVRKSVGYHDLGQVKDHHISQGSIKNLILEVRKKKAPKVEAVLVC